MQQRGHRKLGLYLSFVLILYYCFDASNISVSFSISEIHESEVIAKFLTASQLWKCLLPPLACHSQRETSTSAASSSSTSATGSSSTSNAGQSRLSLTKDTSNAPCRGSALGPFVFNSNGKTGIKSANHAVVLIGILQLAVAHPSGLVGTLGHNNWMPWFQDKIEAIFQSDGTLGMYNPISQLVFLRHFALASTQVREVYDQQHSNDQTGAALKDVPPWIQSFFCLFEAQQNVPSASAQAVETGNERRSVVSGLMGCQASLGNHHGCGPAQLRSKTSTNITARRMRQMYAGDVEIEVVGDDAMHDQMDDILVEGINDTANEHPACHCCTTNGTCQQNAHMEFSAGRNDLAAQFHHVSQAFALLDALTNAVAQSFSATS